MSEIELREKSLKGKECIGVIWRSIPIGFVYFSESRKWKISNDLKGEFWSIIDFSSKNDAIEALVLKKQNLDEFRLKQLSAK